MSEELIREKIADKTVLITGGAGTVGRQLIRRVADFGPREVRVVDIDESGVFFLEQEYLDRNVSVESADFQLNAFVGDVRDANLMQAACGGVDILFHAAALKHVVICERSPYEAVQTNILGVKNVIDAALANNVGIVLNMSSDKAVNPTNVMGTTKLMGERLFTAANGFKKNQTSIFASTRFGNVIGSKGSVVPIFAAQNGRRFPGPGRAHRP
jgi:FlaA1/EpsC-like NDP-sugar epimerase